MCSFLEFAKDPAAGGPKDRASSAEAAAPVPPMEKKDAKVVLGRNGSSERS
jgi:hypothetical protein